MISFIIWTRKLRLREVIYPQVSQQEQRVEHTDSKVHIQGIHGTISLHHMKYKD